MDLKTLYEETMTPEVMPWDSSSKHRALLSTWASLVLNAISTIREAENKHLPIADQIG